MLYLFLLVFGIAYGVPIMFIRLLGVSTLMVRDALTPVFRALIGLILLKELVIAGALLVLFKYFIFFMF